jgi:hypothetical protein
MPKTTKEFPVEPVPVAWRELAQDGSEEVREGHYWAPAPPWRGQRADWVLPDRPRVEDPPGGAVLVVTVSRRHRSGRRGPRAGRYVDVGEVYADPKTWQRTTQVVNRWRVPRRNIPLPPLPAPIYRYLSGMGG